MNRLIAMLFALGGLAALPAGAEPAPAPAMPRHAWEAGLSEESLTRGLPSWRSSYLSGEWKFDGSRLLHGGLRETERYALRDREAHVGGSLPLDAAAQLQLEAGRSDTHRVLAARYGSLLLQFQPASGWSLGAGWRRSAYDSGMTGVASFSAERYLGNERFAYTLFEGGPDGGALLPSHRWQWDHYYGDRDRIGLALVHGRETEYSAGVFLTSRINGTSLTGMHYFAPDWAVNWEAGRLRQGDFYTRSGVRLGLRHSF
jgi:YaiO family outer membrane protein